MDRDVELESIPLEYRYWDHFKDHIKDLKNVFTDELIYPRQMEFHLPGDGKVACNFHCYFCSGKKFSKDLGNWELTGLELIKNLKGEIPYHIYAGSYSEPIINPYILDYVKATKASTSYFGIHTNGSILFRLEKKNEFLTTLCEIAEDKIDYLSVSLDAGFSESHSKTKGLKHDWFSEILEGLSFLSKKNKENGNKLAIRICYLMIEENSSQTEIDSIVNFAKRLGIDSIRFSMPISHYAQDFEIVRKYKEDFELPNEQKYYNMVKKHLTNTEETKVFWFPPSLLDVDILDFSQCVYGYYQITVGADGYLYRCSSIATPTYKDLRLGKLTSDLSEFNNILLKSQDKSFNTHTCFSRNARCNRIGTNINRLWRDFYNGNIKSKEDN